MKEFNSIKNNLQRRIIILIPARSGSKGVVDKNIKSFNGKPLLYWSMAAADYLAEQAKNVTIVVSSDSPKYLQIAKRYPSNKLIQYRFHLRSKSASDDDSSMVQVVNEILNEYCERGMEERYTFILLQPTSPIRSKHDLKMAFDKLIEMGKSTALVTEAGVALEDLFLRIPQYNGTQSVIKELGLKKVERRQDRVTDLLNLDGAFYGFPLVVDGFHLDIRSCFEIPENLVVSMLKRNVEIDTPIDFNVARALHKYYARKEELGLVGL